MEYGYKGQQQYSHAYLLRWICPPLALIILSGCGSPAQHTPADSANTVSITVPLPTLFVEPSVGVPVKAAQAEPTIGTTPTALIVPEETITVDLDGVTWQLSQPRGEEPLVTADNQGILWVRFPPLETGEQGLEKPGIIPRHPVDNYRIMYTPRQPEGGPLEQNAQLMFEIPHHVESDDDDFSQIQQVTSLEAIDRNYFVLGTYTNRAHAVNGGTTRRFWIDLATNTMKTVLEAQQGGGKHLTEAHNERWLFWSHARTGETTAYADSQAFLADLTTGEVTEIDLGESDWAALSYWGDDDKLYFKYDARSIEQYTFDPHTGIVQPMVKP